MRRFQVETAQEGGYRWIIMSGPYPEGCSQNQVRLENTWKVKGQFQEKVLIELGQLFK